MKIMKSKEVKKHWESWAEEFDLELRATTKETNIKLIELSVLEKYIPDYSDVLELGCGNGYDLIYLTSKKNIAAKGVDISEKMIDSAQKLADAIDNDVVLPSSFKKVVPEINKERCKNIVWDVADVLSYEDDKQYDVVYTIRCIINLTTVEKQKQAIKKIAGLVKKDGYFLMMENSIQNYEVQNQARKIVGLKPRSPPSFNLFIDEKVIIPEIKKYFAVENVINHSSLHNIFQYVVLPSVEDKIYYDTPIMNKVTELALGLNDIGLLNNFSNFGQGKLWILKKK